MEIEVLEAACTVSAQKIETINNEVKEFKMALQIPREHYKHLEKLRYEQVINQRDEII